MIGMVWSLVKKNNDQMTKKIEKRLMMKTYNDCIPCLVRQALEAARLVTGNGEAQSKVLKKTLAAIPGTVLGECSDAFQQDFYRADLIVAKGQGNYETLPHDDHRIFFLFKAKCPVVAASAGVELGDMVVRNF